MYVTRRILEAIPLFLLILVINFVILHTAPGDPVSFLVPEGFGTSPEFVAEMRHKFGLDKPLGVQLIIYMCHIFRGNVGYSLYYQAPVITIIGERVPVTFLLVGLSLLFSSFVGIVLGVLAGSRPNSFLDRANTALAVFGYSIPAFWLGQIMILIFGIYFGILPTGGIPIAALGQGGFLDWLRRLILPTITLGVVQLALIARIMRANMLEVLGSDYITVARAKGLREWIVIFKHALRNAILPVVTVIGTNVGFVLTGAMIIETVFSWPGLGRMMMDSLMRRDYPVLLGLLILMSSGVIFINLIVDLLYAYLNPQIVYH